MPLGGSITIGTGTVALSKTGDLTITGKSNIQILGALVLPPTANLSISTLGSISQTGGTITAATLTGSTSGGVTLAAAGNSISALSGFTNTSSAGFTLVNAVSLSTTGVIASSGGVLVISNNNPVVLQTALTTTTPTPQVPIPRVTIFHFRPSHIVGSASGALSGDVNTTVQGLGLGYTATFLDGTGLAAASGSGVLASSGQRTQFASTDVAADLAEAREPRPQDSEWGGWAKIFGNTGTVGGAGTVPDQSITAGGAAFGIDRRIEPDLTIGLGLAYAHADTALEAIDTRSATESAAVALYGAYRFEQAYLTGALGYSYNINDNSRSAAFFGTPGTSRSASHANLFFGGLEYGYRAGTLEDVELTPFLQLQATVLRQSGYTESGYSLSDLAVRGVTDSALVSTLGIEAARRFAFEDSAPLDIALRLGWARELLNESRISTVNFANSQSGFAFNSSKPARDSARLSLGAGSALDAASRVYLRYDGDVSVKDDSHTLTAGVSFGL